MSPTVEFLPILYLVVGSTMQSMLVTVSVGCCIYPKEQPRSKARVPWDDSEACTTYPSRRTYSSTQKYDLFVTRWRSGHQRGTKLNLVEIFNLFERFRLIVESSKTSHFIHFQAYFWAWLPHNSGFGWPIGFGCRLKKKTTRQMSSQIGHFYILA